MTDSLQRCLTALKLLCASEDVQQRTYPQEWNEYVHFAQRVCSVRKLADQVPCLNVTEKFEELLLEIQPEKEGMLSLKYQATALLAVTSPFFGSNKAQFDLESYMTKPDVMTPWFQWLLVYTALSQNVNTPAFHNIWANPNIDWTSDTRLLGGLTSVNVSCLFENNECTKEQYTNVCELRNTAMTKYAWTQAKNYEPELFKHIEILAQYPILYVLAMASNRDWDGDFVTPNSIVLNKIKKASSETEKLLSVVSHRNLNPWFKTMPPEVQENWAKSKDIAKLMDVSPFQIWLRHTEGHATMETDVPIFDASM